MTKAPTRGFGFTCDRRGNRVQVTIEDSGTVVFSDTCDPTSHRSREGLFRAILNDHPKFELDDLEAELLKLSRRTEERKADNDLDDPCKTSDNELAKMPPDIVAEATAMLKAPDLIEQIERDIRSLGVVGEDDLTLTIYFLGVSRLLNKPLGAIVQGASSSGKSYVAEKIASLYPPESVLLATDMTANSLYYVPKGALRHRFIVNGERSRRQDDDTAEKTRALRELRSSGVLRKWIPVKNEDGKHETVSIENPGPAAYIETTTLSEIFEEDANRGLLLASDDTAPQTERVVTATAASYAQPPRDDETDRIVQRHHAAQRLLRRVNVVVPFAESIAAAMPKGRPEARRAIVHVLGLVQAVALVRQFQRIAVPDHGLNITATVDDYEVARRLLLEPLARSLGGGLPSHVTSLATWLKEKMSPTDTATVAQMQTLPGCRWGRTALYEMVRRLEAVGFLADAGMDRRATRYRRAGPLPEAGAAWLPDPAGVSHDLVRTGLAN